MSNSPHLKPANEADLRLSAERKASALVAMFAKMSVQAKSRLLLTLAHLVLSDSQRRAIPHARFEFAPRLDSHEMDRRLAANAEACFAAGQVRSKWSADVRRELNDESRLISNFQDDPFQDEVQARLGAEYEAVRNVHRQQRAALNELRLGALQSAWTKLTASEHARLADELRRIATTAPRALEHRMQADPYLATKAAQLEHAQAQHQQAREAFASLTPSQLLRSNRTARPLWQEVIETAKQLGAMRYDLHRAERQRRIQHESQLLVERGVRGHASAALSRQNSLARDPERRLAFEDFRRTHHALELPDHAHAPVSARVEHVESGRFVLLASSRHRYAVDLADTGLKDAPNVGQEFMAEGHMKLASANGIERDLPDFGMELDS